MPTHYHPSLRNHENFSYGNSRNRLQPPPGFNIKSVEKKSSLKDLLGPFIMETRNHLNKDEAHLDSIETHCSNIGTILKSLEVQMGQLASFMNVKLKGHFPSNMEKNPKEQCKAITLRSGKEIEKEQVQEEGAKEEAAEKEKVNRWL